MKRHYKHPPIREAICEFRFRSAGPSDIAVPGLVYSALRAEFPDRVTSSSSPGQLSITVGALRLGNVQDGAPEGRIEEAIRFGQDLRIWRQGSVDGVIVIGQDRVAISHYAPYRSWENFQPDILAVLNAFKIEATPESIQRIGLRYINEIHFDQESVDPEEFFNYYPNLGEGLPGAYLGLNMNLQFPYEDDRDRLRLGLATRQNAEKTGMIAQLDLDYSLMVPTVTVDESPGWLELAHKHIIEVFEGCLTDKVRDKFEEEAA